MGKDISKMNLGELIAELLNTHDSLKNLKLEELRQEKTDETLSLKIAGIQNYEKSIYGQLDKKEAQYNSYKSEPRFK